MRRVLIAGSGRLSRCMHGAGYGVLQISIKENLPVGSYVGRLKITDEAPDNSYTFTLQGDSIEAGDNLPADFYLSIDTLRTGREFLYNQQNEYTLYIKVQDEFSHVYTEKFIISIL